MTALPAEHLRAARDRARRATPTGRSGHALRPDIEGMRAVAVGLVLLYHAGIPLISGGFVGVDVFFVISGFLITGLLVREMAGTGTLSVIGFYARRAKRLLPATAVVLTFVAVVSAFVISPLQQAGVGWDVMLSALYVINWRLAAQSIDYLAGDVAASPVQHFWSLAIEEQFYFVVPVLLLLLTVRQRRRGGSLTRPVLIGLAAVAVPSLLWSVHLTATSAGQAYFSTTTRVWELALGGGTAVLAHRFARWPAGVAAVTAWVGLGAVVWSALAYSSQTAFPGYAALLPTVGTAAVLACGPAAGANGPVRVIGNAFGRWMGGMSYSLYLWHWPLIIFATAIFGELSPWAGLAVVTFAFLPAALSLRFVEEPFRRSKVLAEKPRRALAVGAVCTAIGVLGGFLLYTTTPQAAAVNDADRAAAVGAQALPDNLHGVDIPPVAQVKGRLVPDPLAAPKDTPYSECLTLTIRSPEITNCTLGDPTGDVTIALVGDSHAAQWMPAVERAAKDQGWKVVTYLKAGCPYASGNFYLGATNSPYPACTAWNTAVQERLLGPDKPDLVLTGASVERQVMIDGKVLSIDASQEPFGEALAHAWGTLEDAGIPVLVVRDTPRPGFDVPECVAAHRKDLTQCAFAPEQAMRADGADAQAAALVPDVDLIDLTSAFCPGTQCPAVIGNVIVYRDDQHVTATYSTTLGPRLESVLTPLVHRALASGG